METPTISIVHLAYNVSFPIGSWLSILFPYYYTCSTRPPHNQTSPPTIDSRATISSAYILQPSSESTSATLNITAHQNPVCSPLPVQPLPPETILRPPDCELAILRIIWDIPASQINQPVQWINVDQKWRDRSCEVNLVRALRYHPTRWIRCLIWTL